MYNVLTHFFQQKQVEKHVLRNTQLTELLHLANEQPIMMRDENWLLHNHTRTTSSSINSSRLPAFVGKSRELNFATEGGMPQHLSVLETNALFRAIKANTKSINSFPTTAPKAVLWHPPITACNAMVTHFIDRQLLHNDESKYVRVILRAQTFFQNKPANANVKVAVAYDTGVRIHFGKCVVFLKDSDDEYFVLLQWYDQVLGTEPFHSVSGLVQLELRPQNVTKSYSVMPISSIVNGALIITSENKLWVLLSPRESIAYEQTNS
jgi:hypothetical protein